MDVYNQFAKFFIQLSFSLFIPLFFPEIQHALRLAIIYHSVGQNTRTKIQKDVFLSKMPFDECSAAMSFQVGFKSLGFFFVFKGNHIFDAPRFVFGCVRNIAFVVFFKAGF